MGFGGFLIGIGIGWILTSYLELSRTTFSWLIMFAGVLVIATSIISRTSFGKEFGGLTNGLVVGLVLSLFVTSGFSFFTGIFNGDSFGDYRARDTMTFDGTITLNKIYLDADNFNGPITVSTWQKNEYSVELDIRARREEYLDDLKVDFDTIEESSTQKITLEYDIPETSKSRYSIGVEIFLPENAFTNLDLRSSNGGITLNDVEGKTIDLKTSNGALKLNNVYADEINGETSNGGLSGTLEAPTTSLITSNGAIDLVLPSTISGDYRLRTSNGGIDLYLSSSFLVGYDLEFSTSNGGISVDVPDLDFSINQNTRKEAKTEGFASKDVQISIDASTSNSGIDIDS
jgi:DUF4097 and DUF4098 domain-containing protein YvlB